MRYRVSTWMGDRPRADKPPRYVTSHPGQLSQAIPLWELVSFGDLPRNRPIRSMRKSVSSCENMAKSVACALGETRRLFLPVVSEHILVRAVLQLPVPSFEIFFLCTSATILPYCLFGDVSKLFFFNRLWAGKPCRYVTGHLGQLSLLSLRSR